MTYARAKAFAPILTALAPILSRVPNQVIYDDEHGFQLKLDGFYKDGSITIRVVEDNDPYYKVEIHGRYEVLEELMDMRLLTMGNDMESALEDLRNLVLRVQVARFRYWNEVKPETAPAIDSNWLPVLLAAGLVKTELKTIYSIA